MPSGRDCSARGGAQVRIHPVAFGVLVLLDALLDCGSLPLGRLCQLGRELHPHRLTLGALARSMDQPAERHALRTVGRDGRRHLQFATARRRDRATLEKGRHVLHGEGKDGAARVAGLSANARECVAEHALGSRLLAIVHHLPREPLHERGRLAAERGDVRVEGHRAHHGLRIGDALRAQPHFHLNDRRKLSHDIHERRAPRG
mmetsp:Transcript_6740/g.17615  ORF Transcript_6740/g.17615 Transcript_6740/m.17615 type:complete len:203 (+) Transcript_6740:221-829(+)